MNRRLALAPLALMLLAGCAGRERSRAADPPPPAYGSPGSSPAGPPPGGGFSAPPPAPPPGAPPAGLPLPPPPPGSVDAGGTMTEAFVRAAPHAVLAELVAALPEPSRARVANVPLLVVPDPREVNAFAGCTKSGGAVMGITTPLLLFAARTSEARAFDELYGTRKYEQLASGIADEVRAERPISGPPPGFLPTPQALDPRKLARQRFLYDQQLAFVLGHELAHHYRGHTGCAGGGAAHGVTPEDVGRLLSRAVPFLNQPNEIDSDVHGTNNLLDAGARRGLSGAWSEEGALMVIDFFARLQALGIETVLLGFLMTHPPPQLRAPIVTNTAQQWRAAGGKAPAWPFGWPAFPSGG